MVLIITTSKYLQVIKINIYTISQSAISFKMPDSLSTVYLRADVIQTR